MPELEILEARVPVRTPVLVKEAETGSTRLGPVAGWLNGPVFSRARDIFAANMTELLDRAEDPARMIRTIIMEMEETLVEVRATAARSIADIKEIRRAVGRLDELQADWTGKAELALSKGRDDLAKAALVERQKAGEMVDGLRDELDQMEQVLRGYEADIARLQGKLREARPGRTRSRPASKARSRGPGRVRSCTAAGRLTRSPSSSCSSGARTSPKAAVKPSESPRSKTKSTQLKSGEKIDAELEAMKAARAAKLRARTN